MLHNNEVIKETIAQEQAKRREAFRMFLLLMYVCGNGSRHAQTALSREG